MARMPGETIRGLSSTPRYDPTTRSDEKTTGASVAVASAQVMACPPGRLVACTPYTAAVVVRTRRVVTVVVLLAIVGLTVAIWPADRGIASVGDFEVTAGSAEVSGMDSTLGPGASGPLAEGSVVHTGAAGAATIALGKSGVARLGPGTLVALDRGTDDDPAATPTRRLAVDTGHLWVRQSRSSDAVPTVVSAAGVALRVADGAADVGCSAAGCVVRVVSGEVVATAGWDRFRLHAGESVHFGPHGEVGRLEVVGASALGADEWIAGNVAADESVFGGSGDLGAGEEPTLVDAQIEGTWQVNTTVVETATAVRPVGPEPARTWGVSRTCDGGECRLGVVDTDAGSTVVGAGRSVGAAEHIEGITRTYDCVATGTGDETAHDAIAEARSAEVRAVAAVRSGGRWLASEVVGSGSGDLYWAGRGRTCRGVRPGAFRFDLGATRLDVAS